jgi:cell division protein FtsQ
MRKILIFFLGAIIIFFTLDLEKLDDLTSKISIKHLIDSFKKEVFENNIKIKEVVILNTTNLEKKRILEGFEIDWNQNIFEIDLQNIKKKLLNIKEIKSVKIKKKIGGKLEIYIVEKIPFMYWEINGLKRIISNDGQVLNFPNFNEKLLSVKGKNANKKVKSLIDKIKKNNFVVSQFLKAEYISNYRWDIYLKENILVRLPFENLTNSIRLLDEMIKNNNFNNRNYSVIDMRVNGKVFFK